MTTTAATSSKELFQTLGISSATEAKVVYHQFMVNNPIPVRNAINLNEMVSEHEKDPVKAKHLKEARQKFAENYHKDDKSLTALRLRAGLSQVKLAELMKTSQPHIAKIEQGKNDPSTELISKLATALGVSEAEAFIAVRESITKGKSHG